MKKLYILRHAKSSWAEKGIADMNRPLTKKGIENAHQKGRDLALRNITVDLIITSPAFRALNTSIIIAQHINYPVDTIQINKEVYNSSVKKLSKILRHFGDNISSLMIIGHNPELLEFVNSLIKAKIKKIPTSGLVCIEFSSFGTKKGNMFHFDFSKS